MTSSGRILSISTVLLLAWTSFCGEELNEIDKKNEKAPSLMEELTVILQHHASPTKPYILGEPTQLLMELHSFVTAGPETSIVYTTQILSEEEWKRLCETNAPGAIPVRSRRVVKQRFSEADVAAGKARNNEARRCVVQLFLDGLNNMDDSTAASVLVMCSEILDSAQLIAYEANGLDYQEIMENAARCVIADKTRPLEIRLLAMPFIRTGSQDEKLSLLKALDDELNANDGGLSWEGNREEVRRRIRGMRERVTLDNNPWKRAVIDEALERPANPVENAEDAEKQEIAIDIVL